MSTNYSGSTVSGTIADNGTVTIQEPSDGDALTAASVNTALSKLADIVQWLVLNTAKRSSNTTPAESIFNNTTIQMGADNLAQFQFEFPHLGVAGQHDQYRAQIFDFFSFANQKVGVYLNAVGGCIEITAGCIWSFSLQKWVGDNGAIVLRLFPGGGPVLLTKFTGDNVNGWPDVVGSGGGWDSQISLYNTASTKQGDVLGFSSLAPNMASFGRVREALSNITTDIGWANGYGTLTAAPQCFKDASGCVHLVGGANTTNTSTYGTILGTLPTGYRPAANINVVGPSNSTKGVQITILSTGVIQATGYLDGTALPTNSAFGFGLDGIVFPVPV